MEFCFGCSFLNQRKYDQTGKKRAIAGYLPLIRLIIKLLIKLNILLIEKKNSNTRLEIDF